MTAGHPFPAMGGWSPGPDVRWEHQVVVSMVRQLGLQRILPQLKELAEHGTNRLFTIDAFMEVVPEFPLHLFCASGLKEKLHLDQKHVFPCWFNDFAALPVTMRFAEMVEETGAAVRARDEGKPIAMVFERKGVRGGLVMHTAGASYLRNGMAALLYHATDRTVVAVQRFWDVLEIFKELSYG